jgi:hypothetical protein
MWETSPIKSYNLLETSFLGQENQSTAVTVAAQLHKGHWKQWWFLCLWLTIRLFLVVGLIAFSIYSHFSIFSFTQNLGWWSPWTNILRNGLKASNRLFGSQFGNMIFAWIAVSFINPNYPQICYMKSPQKKGCRFVGGGCLPYWNKVNRGWCLFQIMSIIIN